MNPRFPIGTRVIVDLYRFDTPQQGIVVPWVGWGHSKDVVCIHFFNSEVTERYTCNNTECDRGYLTFSNDPGHNVFTLSMIHNSVLKDNLEVTNET